MKNCKKILILIATIVITLTALNIKVFAFENTEETLTYKNLVGENRFDTSIRISREAYPNGAKNIILVNGTSNIDGIPASTLANKLSAPVILTPADKLTEEAKKEISRLKPENVYLIGGTSAISNNVINELKELKELRNIKTVRLYGNNRYETATAVARFVGSFDKIIICNSADNGVNAAAVSGIAAQNNIPILYNDSANNINATTYKFAKSYAKTIYMIGNEMSLSQKNDLEYNKINVIKIKSTNPQDINCEMLNKFNTIYDNAVLVNNPVDAMTISYLTAKNQSLYLYTGDKMTQAQKDIVANNDISKIYYTGGGKIKGPLKEVISILKNISTSENELKFNKSNVVFYVPHQDDETLYFGQTILKAIKEKGAQNVYVVMLTDGASSGINTNKNNKDYAKVKNLLNKYGLTFTDARDNEYLAACLALGLPKTNILFNEDIGLTRIKDGKVQADVVKRTMLYFENKFNGDVTHITYTFEYDYHSDHLQCGKALNELYYDLNLEEESFTSVYFIARANYKITGNKTPIITLKEISNGTRLINALNKFVYANHSTIKDEIRIGIGYMSVNSEINAAKTSVINNTLTTNLHLPY